MREIKFRAWDMHNEEMVVLNSLDFYTDGSISMANITSPIIPDSPVNRHTADDLILLQFTGLKDKNGKEIYEGDIVKYKEMDGFECDDEDYLNYGKERIGTVTFEDGNFTPREYYHYCDDGFYSWRRHSFEVIGNIYENPELLNNK